MEWWQTATAEQKLEAIKAEIEGGAKSARDIAVRLGVTTNMVGGMCHRHKIKLPGTCRNAGKKPHNWNKRRRRDMVDAQKVAQQRRINQRVPRTRPVAASRFRGEPPVPSHRQGRPVNIFTIHPTRDCHFPAWGNEHGIPVEEKFYCGEPVASVADGALPYCAACLKRRGGGGDALAGQAR
jgi:hypothetical protein